MIPININNNNNNNFRSFRQRINEPVQLSPKIESNLIPKFSRENKRLNNTSLLNNLINGEEDEEGIIDEYLINNEYKPVKVQASEEELYENNGGTTVSIITDNKIIIAADTRHSGEYNINSRYVSKIYKIGHLFLSCVGFQGDAEKCFIDLSYHVEKYSHYKKMSITSAAKALSNILYQRRFFPLYSYCSLSGFEEKKDEKSGEKINVPVIYSFDCVGSYQRVQCIVEGSSNKLIQPLLDSVIDGKNYENYKKLDFKSSLELIKKAFDSATEIDVKTGDYLEIFVYDGINVKREVLELRKD